LKNVVATMKEIGLINRNYKYYVIWTTLIWQKKNVMVKSWKRLFV